MKTYRVDHARRAVFVEYTAVVGDADVDLGASELNDLASEYVFLVDMRAVEDFSITTRLIRELGQQWHARRRCAVMASTDVAFGLARMIAAYSDNPAVGVFRTEEQAREWIRVAK